MNSRDKTECRSDQRGSRAHKMLKESDHVLEDGRVMKKTHLRNL